MADETETKQEPEATVTFTFPKKTKVTDAQGLIHTFDVGIHEVPESLADNPYLAACGAKKYDPSAKPEEGEVRLPGSREVQFLQSKNYPVVTDYDAIAFVGRLSEEDKESFWKDVDKWDAERNEEAKKAGEPGGTVESYGVTTTPPTAVTMQTAEEGEEGKAYRTPPHLRRRR